MDINQLSDLNEYINIVVCSIGSILLFSYLIRFKFRIDLSALFILLTYEIVMFFRIFLLDADYIQPIGATLIWAGLLYFVFEMRYIRVTLES